MPQRDAPETHEEERPRLGRPPRGRFPGWILVVLGGAVGWFVSSWMGGILGALLGLLIWRGRG